MKRSFDFILASIGLVLLSPIFVIIALFIKLTSPGPVFFRQERVGLRGKVFKIHKFRTMITNAEKVGPKITIGEDNRITKFGRIMRKTKLDELPQLIDVFIGNMSLVGPRPEVLEYVAIYPIAIKEKVLSVRPGMTDFASIIMIDENQILAKSMTPKDLYVNEILPKKLNLAVKYVETRSFIQDLKIIFITIVKLFKR